MKGTIQKWKLVILLDALLFLSNMTFAKDTINQYTEGNPIDTTAVSISDKTNIPDRLYVDSLSLKRHFIHRIGIEARPGYIFPTSSFFRGENLNWKPIENSLSLHLKYSFQFHPNTYNDRIYRGAYLLMKSGKVMGFGSPKEIITSETLQSVYDIEMDVITTHDRYGRERTICLPVNSSAKTVHEK